MACFTFLLTLGIVAPGGSLSFISFTERIASVPPNHRLTRALDYSPKSYVTHVPDQLLALVIPDNFLMRTWWLSDLAVVL